LEELVSKADLSEEGTLDKIMNDLPKQPALRRSTIAAIACKIGSLEPEQIRSWLGQMAPEEQRALAENSQIGYYLHYSHPHVLLDLAQQHAGDDPKSLWWDYALDAKSYEGPQETLSWIQQQKNPEIKQRLLNEYFGSLNGDVTSLAPLLEQITDPEEQKTARSNLLRNWLVQDEAAAKAWGAKFPDTASVIMGNEFGERMAANPSHAAAELPRLLQSEDQNLVETLTGYAEGLTRTLYGRSRQEAQHFLQSLPEGKARTSATATLMENWLIDDSHAASQWVATLPAGEARDAASREVYEHVLHTDPEAAFHWAQQITDVRSREEGILSSLGYWYAEDKEAAKTALLKAPLRPEEKESILKSWK
jgi:hypothetical protein